MYTARSAATGIRRTCSIRCSLATSFTTVSAITNTSAASTRCSQPRRTEYRNMDEAQLPQATREALAKSPQRREWDGVAAVIAAFVGLLALCVSGYTAYLQRQQVRAQVWPYLETGISSSKRGVSLSNKGVGPAIIRSAQVLVDG